MSINFICSMSKKQLFFFRGIKKTILIYTVSENSRNLIKIHGLKLIKIKRINLG